VNLNLYKLLKGKGPTKSLSLSLENPHNSHFAYAKVNFFYLFLFVGHLCSPMMAQYDYMYIITDMYLSFDNLFSFSAALFHVCISAFVCWSYV
jgi:hypothetical protein